MIRRNGVSSISTGAMKLMNLKESDMVQVHQSDEDPTEWYIEKVSKDGFPLRHNHNKTCLMFNCSLLVKSVFDSVGFEGRSTRFYIGESIEFGKQTLYTIITAPVKTLG